jgi:hypothetical protein
VVIPGGQQFVLPLHIGAKMNEVDAGGLKTEMSVGL